jgi:predicted nucleic acid-binding protein
MKAVFADTFFFLAAVNPRDAAHTRAITFVNQFDGQLVTTDWVLLEVANALAGGRNRAAVVELVNSLKGNPNVKLVPLDAGLQQRGFALYAQRLDKEWSLTDCITFLVMSDAGLTDALTEDHHFEQAGFSTLLK